MLHIHRIALSMGVLVLLSAGCIFTPKKVKPDDPPDIFEELTAPERLIVNLQVSYRRKEIARYAELLATDFIFRFQPVDQTENGEFWTFTEDSTGTDGLFRSPEVGSIRIDLLHDQPEEPSEVGFDPDVKKVRINAVQLEADLKNGTTLLVTDAQDMYFRPGREALGEDPGRWYLLEWRDIPSAGSPRVSPLGAGDGSTTAEEGAPNHTSWGALLTGARTP